MDGVERVHQVDAQHRIKRHGGLTSLHLSHNPTPIQSINQSTHRAVERLCAKLEEVRGTGQEVEIGEMFRHLTLQVRKGPRPFSLSLSFSLCVCVCVRARARIQMYVSSE
jgi:hypothetical protein